MKIKRTLTVSVLNLGLILMMCLFASLAQAVSQAQPLLQPGNPITNPMGNTHTVPPTATVSITYDESINPSTVSTRTFAVYAMRTGLLTQTYGVNGGTISLTPLQPFKPGELIQTTATTGTLSAIDGLGPITPTVWQFWTAVLGGSGVFTDTGQNLGNSNSRGMAMGDLDGDGDLDVLITNDSNQANKVWLNDGTGIFVDSGQSLGNASSQTGDLGDLDGDGDLDAFVANGHPSGEGNTVWLNDGTGTFIDTGQSLGNSASSAVTLGDVDGDGDLDAFIGNYGQGNTVWLNDGTGTFNDTGQSLGGGREPARTAGRRRR